MTPSDNFAFYVVKFDEIVSVRHHNFCFLEDNVVTCGLSNFLKSQPEFWQCWGYLSLGLSSAKARQSVFTALNYLCLIWCHCRVPLTAGFFKDAIKTLGKRPSPQQIPVCIFSYKLVFARVCLIMQQICPLHSYFFEDI